MENRVLLVCEEEGCSEKALEEVMEDWWERGLTVAYILRVIKQPPMMWVEHGGADTEEEEKALEMENRKKREEWTAHEEKIHGKGIKKIVDIFSKFEVKEVKVKFVQEEFSFSGSILNEVNEGGYNILIIDENIWDRLDGRKVDSEIEVLTVPTLNIGTTI